MFNLYLFQVAHENLMKNLQFKEQFLVILASLLPNIETFSEDSLNNVFDVLTRKICNTRIQEFVSATKQEFSAKKGLASTVDVNLRTTLLAHHTKLETKISSN